MIWRKMLTKLDGEGESLPWNEAQSPPRFLLPALHGKSCGVFLHKRDKYPQCGCRAIHGIGRRVKFMVRAVLYHAVALELLRDVKKWSFPAAGQLSRARRLNPT
jgi:hypothetical protein